MKNIEKLDQVSGESGNIDASPDVKLDTKNEIVFEADSNFIKSVNDLLEKHPMLKDIINKKNNIDSHKVI